MENGSLGVINALRMSTAIKACFRSFRSWDLCTTPRLESTRIMVGNSNSSPIRNTMEVKRDM